MYNPLLWWLLVGAVAPVFTWLLTQRYPKTWVRVRLYASFLVNPSAMSDFSRYSSSTFLLLLTELSSCRLRLASILHPGSSLALSSVRFEKIKHLLS